MKDYYSILQVEENATQDEIKHAYHKMARLFHPDNFSGSQEEAGEQMAKINEAYQILSDANKRVLYDADRQLRKGASKAGTAHESYSNAEKKDTANTDDPIKSYNSFGQGCSTYLAAIIKLAFYIGIIYVIFHHWDFTDKKQETSNTNRPTAAYDQSRDNGKKKIADEYMKRKPEKVVEKYFEYMRKGKVNKANKLFGSKADENFQNFQDFTVDDYNRMILSFYYEPKKEIPTYPLFEEIKNFSFRITDVNKAKGYAEVNVELKNCDVVMLFRFFLEGDDYKKTLERSSDSQIQDMLKKIIKYYRDSCLMDANVTFRLKKNKKGYWKIDKISPLKDFSTVMVGQADDLLRLLSGEDVDAYSDEKNASEDW